MIHDVTKSTGRVDGGSMQLRRIFMTPAIIEVNRPNDGTVALSFRHMHQLHQISSGPRLRTPKHTANSLELGVEVIGIGKAWQSSVVSSLPSAS